MHTIWVQFAHSVHSEQKTYLMAFEALKLTAMKEETLVSAINSSLVFMK